jgi:imidazolonepropionase-like amidohydrolase
MLVDGRVEVNPTLVMTETLKFSNDSRVLERLEPSFAPREIAAAWRAESHPYTRELTVEYFRETQAAFPTILDVVRLFHERGVLLTAGTDVGNPWITPGVSFHRELELLVRAGIDPLDVLSIATRNGAEALGILDEVGTIEPGKIANLVVLRANPLASISDTRLIDLVIQRGEVLQPDTIISN